MDVLGYFLALTNLQSVQPILTSIALVAWANGMTNSSCTKQLAIGGRSPDLNDVSVKMADLSTLANYLKNYPGFNIQDFKEDQVNHVGDIGMYLSSNLRKFCLNGDGNAKDEGVIITFTYKASEDDKKETNFAQHSFLIRKEGLPDDTVRPLLQQLHNYNDNRNKFIIFTGEA